MSSSNRTTSKGGKGSKTDNKSHKTDKSDTGKGSDKQPGNNSKSEDPSINDKVRQLIEMTQRSEEEVCAALQEHDYDMNTAINMLLENEGHGEWETRVKKKKNRQASASKQDKQEEVATGDEWNDNPPQSGGGSSGGNEKDKSRNKNGPPRLHGRHNDSRGWRGREKQENDRNLEEGGGWRPDNRERRGRPGGSTRGPGGGRGRGGGRAGGRYPPRGGRNNTYNKPIDTWDNSNTWDNNTVATTNHTSDNWDFPGTDEWTTEEYTGSLADTKVFTPSVQQAGDVIGEAPPVGIPLDNAVINAAGQQLGQTLQMSSQAPQLPSQSPVQMGGSLNAAQTQYFTQLTQQNSDNIKQYGSAQTYHAQTTPQVYNSGSVPANQSYANSQQYGTSSNAYNVNSSYASNNNYANPQEQQPSQQPTRTKTQRARVPPPSKIPSSAVEMPGDLNSSIGYLDVQFGAMDFMSEANTFDGDGGKYGPTNPAGLDSTSGVASTGNIDLNATNQNSTLDAYSPKTNAQSSISSALITQSLTDSIPQTSEHLTSAYNTAPRSSTTGGGSTVTPSATPSGLDIGKQQDNHSYSQSSTYNSYQQHKNNTYNASTYSGTQTSNSYVSNQANSNYANSQTTPYNSGNTYQNAYSSAASYQSNANAASYPSTSQANSYPLNNQTYQQNSAQSGYGANTGLNNSSNFGNNTTTSQYSSYSSSSNHKLGKDSSNYDNSSNAVSNVQTTTSSNATSTTALSLSQTTVSVTKSTATLAAAKNSSSVVSNIPPGVTPVMGTQYIMGQMPYFQPPPVYSYEDMQMLQQRLPHMTTPYYDMSYQTPTTLAAVRDGSLGNVGYSISDGRFTRGDNNASPVPSTLSQQTSTLTQGHQAQPILAGTGPPYFFTAALNTFPNYQFGAMYTQLPAATNAHGSSNSTQYPKPATYGSGYNSYDTLNQTQDYSKTGYVGNNQGQKGSGVNATSTGSSGNDLSAMYGKSHAALGKVNSYDKHGFHSGTPPPFTGALHSGQNAGLAPSGTGYAPQVYIPTMTPHQQQLSTQLMHQPLHQMDVRHQGRRMDSGNNSGQRSQASNQAKGAAKQPYQASYWNQA